MVDADCVAVDHVGLYRVIVTASKSILGFAIVPLFQPLPYICFFIFLIFLADTIIPSCSSVNRFLLFQVGIKLVSIYFRSLSISRFDGIIVAHSTQFGS